MATSSNFYTTEQADPLPICPPLDVGFMTNSSCDYRLKPIIQTIKFDITLFCIIAA